MLHQFTWQQFLVAALILSFIWYGAVILLFYRKQIREILRGKHKPGSVQEPLAHAWDEEFEDEPLPEDENLMGKSALPEGMTRLSMAQFGFAPSPGEPTFKQEVNKNWEQKKDFENETTDDARERQLGLIPDVLEELKSIFHILETEQGNKVDFISLFGLVSSKYPRIKGTSNQQALNDYIRENLPFSISDEELNSLWS
jgi:hypothetical protein